MSAIESTSKCSPSLPGITKTATFGRTLIDAARPTSECDLKGHVTQRLIIGADGKRYGFQPLTHCDRCGSELITPEHPVVATIKQHMGKTFGEQKSAAIRTITTPAQA